MTQLIDYDLSDIRDELEKIRLNKKMSYKELAQEIPIDKSGLYLFIKKGKGIGYPNLRKISEYLEKERNK